MTSILYPSQFLQVRVQKLAGNPEYVTLCAGYEGKKWRSPQMAEDLMSWVPYAALSQEDQLAFGLHNYRTFIQRAAYHIYAKKDETRGEVGELLLHQACVQYHNATPVVCKLILKTSPNDVVKGYDGVYVVANQDDIEIWLGEAKFYKDAKSAVAAAVKSIKDHFLPAFINAEKAMIVGHITKDTPYYDQLVHLFLNQTSADKLFSKAVFPVLVTYESESIAGHISVCSELEEALKEEAEDISSKFGELIKQYGLKLQLILIPLLSKEELLHQFDTRLEAHIVKP
ncbi:HamA C-terminal domain-containing protein [Neorhizobium alkalisoli]|nr:DUF1837 domain-containing protein [Neorhizobium alkalisoli]